MWVVSMKNRIKKIAQSLFTGVRLIWKTSPMYFLFILFINTISGATVPLNALIWQGFLNESTISMINGVWNNTLLLYLFAMSAVSIVVHLLNNALQYFQQQLSDQLDMKVTKEVLGRAVEFPMEMFDDANTYNQLNLAISQTTQQCYSLLNTIGELIYSSISVFGVTAITIQYGVGIVAVSIISSIPLIVISLNINLYWYKIIKERTEKTRLIQYLKTILIKNDNVKEIKLFRLGDSILKYIITIYSSFISQDKVVRKKHIIKKEIAQTFDEIVTLGVKIWILVFAFSRNTSIGTIVLLLNAQTNLKNGIALFLQQLSGIQNSSLYLNAIEEIEHISIPMASTTGVEIHEIKSIKFDHVSFKYPKTNNWALKDVCLDFEMGNTYSIVGFNGSGKTTLIKLLIGLYKPTRGNIFVNGIDIEKISLATYYQQIRAVFQDFIKYPFSVEENIAITDINNKTSDIGEVQKAAKIADVIDFVDKLPNKFATKMLRDWSGGIDISQGQWQKVAIARALFANLPLVILDEPFSSVDAEAESRIVENIRSNRTNKMSIFVTHRFSSISLSDKIFLFENGKVEEQGTHSELVALGGTYAKLYSLQISSIREL